MNDINQLLKVLKALSDKNRLRIIKLLQQKQMCVCELTAIIGTSQPSVSKHLRILKEAGLIIDEKDDNWIDYRINESYNSIYEKELLSLIKVFLKDDDIIQSDLSKSDSVSRYKIKNQNNKNIEEPL